MIALSALEDALRKNFNRGLPMLIGHDFHRPIGWTIPFALFIEPRLARLFAKKVIATNQEELLVFGNAVNGFLNQKVMESFEKHKQNFVPLIEGHLSEGYKRVDAGSVAIYDTGIVTRNFPALFAEPDKSGLISLSSILKEFSYLGQGVFKHSKSDLCIYAHSFFRRSQSRLNNFRFYFLDALIGLKNRKEIAIKIRLDKDMIGYAPSFHERGELEYHWGPKYQDDISQIKSGICRHECNVDEKNFYGISSTEFYWKKEDESMVLEIEELTDNPSPVSNELYHCRYVHSIYNSSEKEFVHFDGAIRSYSEESMIERIDKNFVEYGRKAMYKKLFRIDGKLELDTWKLLITHFYQGNPLIYEYFGLNGPRIIPQMSKSKPLIDQLIPFNVQKEEGIKLLVSYHPIPENIREGRYVDILDVMVNDEGKFACLEQLIYEVKAALWLVKEDLEVPTNVELNKIEDRYWNIPSIMHYGNNVPQKLHGTIKAMILLFKSMVEKKIDKDISLTLSFKLDEKIVRISSFGNIVNQIKWLENNFPFEHTESAFSKWVTRQREYINQYDENSEDSAFEHLIQTDGVLYLKRKPVHFDYHVDVDEKGLKYSINYPKEDPILDLIDRNEIKPVLCISVREARWADTGEDYFTSNRSKFINSTSFVKIEKWEPLALYWSK